MSGSEPRESDERPTARKRAPLLELGIGAGWLLGLTAALTLADGFLSSVPIARAILGGLVASIAAGRAGVVWDRDDPVGESPRRAIRGSVVGAGAAATACLVTLVGSHVAGLGVIGKGQPSLMLGLAIVAAIAGAVREEVLFRAIPMHFGAQAGLSPRWAVGFATLASSSPFLLAPATTWPSVALASAAGLLSALLLARTGSLWASVGATTAFSLFAGPLTQGGLFEMAWTNGELSRGASASGPPALIGAAAFLAIALVTGRGPLTVGAPSIKPDGALPSRPRSPRSRRR